MTKIVELQNSARDHAEYGRNMLLFAFNAHSYDAQRGYLRAAEDFQNKSARLYKAARDLMNVEVQ